MFTQITFYAYLLYKQSPVSFRTSEISNTEIYFNAWTDGRHAHCSHLCLYSRARAYVHLNIVLTDRIELESHRRAVTGQRQHTMSAQVPGRHIKKHRPRPVLENQFLLTHKAGRPTCKCVLEIHYNLFLTFPAPILLLLLQGQKPSSTIYRVNTILYGKHLIFYL